MSNDVYANGNSIACKAGDDKVLAAFPDVCLSPPSPPAGPIPVPYPNTSFSKDMQSGSTTVKIGGAEVMLKDQSFYKTSPLGDEAATKSFGGSVVTHVITGKTYFSAWSMDVKFEGENVDRHRDLTTSNHASFPGGPPTNALEKQMAAEVKLGICPCCQEPAHASGQPMNANQWYEHRADREGDTIARPAKVTKAGVVKAPARAEKLVPAKKAEAQSMLADAGARAGCTCPKPVTTKVMPEPPCNVFYSIPPAPPGAGGAPDLAAANAQQTANTDASRKIWSGPAGQPALGVKAKFAADTGCTGEVMHLVPLSAGGCPGAPGKYGNLQCKDDLCGPCKSIDDRFSGKGSFTGQTQFQNVNINN